jgi:hypothetical protein
MCRVNHARLLSVAVVLVFATICASASTAATRAWLLDEIKALTATDMDGRASGTPGGERAAHHIAGVLRDAGLRTAIGGDYFQVFALSPRPEVQPPSRLVLSPDGRPLTLAKDWTPLGSSPDGVAEASVVFVGYGISAPELGYDDYAGVDVRDRIVLAMSGEPRRGDPTSPFARSGTPPHGFRLQRDPRDDVPGVRLSMVVPESAADRAGVRPGDVIVRFGGVRVYTFEDLRELISARKAAEGAEIVYLRDGGERTVDATLGARQ